MRLLDSITNTVDMSLSKLQEMVKGGLECCIPWSHKESDMTERLNTTATPYYYKGKYLCLKDWLNGYKNKTPIYVVYKRPTSKKGTHTE